MHREHDAVAAPPLGPDDRRAFAYPWIPPPRAGDLVIVGGWPDGAHPGAAWAPPPHGPPPPRGQGTEEVPPALKRSLIAISALDLAVIIALFIVDYMYDNGGISAAQWILLPMVLNRIASLVALARDNLNVAPSMLQICLALINLVLAMQNSRNRCEDRSAVQCPPVGIAASLLIVEIFFTLVIVFLVMWAPLCCMRALPRRPQSPADEPQVDMTRSGPIGGYNPWYPPYRFDDMQPGGDAEAPPAKVKHTKFFRVENPGSGDDCILALRVEPSGKPAPEATVEAAQKLPPPDLERPPAPRDGPQNV